MKFNLGEHKVLTDKDDFYIAENARMQVSGLEQL